jgi:hypothetical protein
MTFEELLGNLTAQIDKYYHTSSDDGNTLSDILKRITSTLYFLEKERAHYHSVYQSKVNTLIAGGLAVNRAVNQAEIEVPEMYLLRRVMDSAYEVAGAIRTNISWIKSGLTN